MKMADTEDFRIDEINGLLTFLQKIEWKDPWLLGLIVFHITVTLTTILTRNYGNFQVVLFLILLSLVYFSESINEFASNYWNLFSRQQYFDSKGMFISLVFSTPILLNCMVLVASWLYQSSQLMTKLKQAQLQAQFVKQNQKRNRDNEKINSRPLSYANFDLISRLKQRPARHIDDSEMPHMKTIDATGVNST